MMERPETLLGWTDLLVEKLSGWAAERTRRLPSWDRVLVTEEENGQRTGPWTPIQEFEDRFQSILKSTTRGWVNLHAERVERGVLFVVVEYISRKDKDAVNTPTDQISVNLSGPRVEWLETLPAENPTG